MFLFFVYLLMEFIKNNAIQIMIGIFSLGGIYSRFLIMENDIEVIEHRLEKKVKLINELDKRIDNLEKCNH